MDNLPFQDENGNMKPLYTGKISYFLDAKTDSKIRISVKVDIEKHIRKVIQSGTEGFIEVNKTEQTIGFTDRDGLVIPFDFIKSVRLMYCYRRATYGSNIGTMHFRGPEMGLDLADGLYLPIALDTVENTVLSDIKKDREMLKKTGRQAKLIADFMGKPLVLGRPKKIIDEKTKALKTNEKGELISMAILVMAFMIPSAYIGNLIARGEISGWDVVWGILGIIALLGIMYSMVFFPTRKSKTYDAIIIHSIE